MVSAFSLPGRSAALLLVAFLPAATSAPTQVDRAAVRGRVTDSAGNGVVSADVTLDCPARAAAGRHTATATDGAYRFDGVEPCSYRLTVTAAGFRDQTLQLVVKSASLQEADVIRLQSRSAEGNQEAPKFQAAGIHGLIDPGGYSASATATQATNVLTDVSDVQRGNTGPGVVTLHDCTEFQRLVETARLHPNLFEPNYQVGLFLLRHGSYAKAAGYFQTAVRLKPSSSDARISLSEALIRSGRFTEGERLLRTSAPDLTSWRLYQLRAQAAEGLGQFEQAVNEYTAGLKAFPSEDHAFALAYEQVLAGSIADAEQTLTLGLKRHPRSVGLSVGLGAVFFFEHRNEVAVDALLTAAALDAADPRPYPLLSHVGIARGTFDQRVWQAMEHHLAAEPTDAAGYAAAGTYLLQYSSWAQNTKSGADPKAVRAEQLLRRAIEISPDLREARLDLATIFQRTGRYQDEVTQLNRVAEYKPVSRNVLYRLSMAYRHLGQPERAAALLRQMSSMPANDSAAQFSQQDVARLLSVSPEPLVQGDPGAVCSAKP